MLVYNIRFYESRILFLVQLYNETVTLLEGADNIYRSLEEAWRRGALYVSLQKCTPERTGEQGRPTKARKTCALSSEVCFCARGEAYIKRFDSNGKKYVGETEKSV